MDTTLLKLFQNNEEVIRTIDINTLKLHNSKLSDVSFTVEEDMIRLYNNLGFKLICSNEEEILTENGFVKAKDFMKHGFRQKNPLIVFHEGNIHKPYVTKIDFYGYDTCVNFKTDENKATVVNGFLVRKYG